jgi:excisionase family DNA binding protein
MNTIINKINRPSQEERLQAMESYNALASTIEKLTSENPEIEIDETDERIKVPLNALKLFAAILRAISEGKPVSIVAPATEMTTQAAAEMLGFSRPHLVKLLEEGVIPFTLVGRHRRIRFEDVISYRNKMKKNQKDLLIQIMRGDEELGLYDS